MLILLLYNIALVTGCADSLGITLGILIPLTLIVAVVVFIFLMLLFRQRSHVCRKHKKMDQDFVKGATQIFANKAYGKHEKQTETAPQSTDETYI